MIDILMKIIYSGIFVVLISFLMKTKYYFLSGLLPLFPTFMLISHYVAGTTASSTHFKNVIVFGMWSLIPYFVYLITIYYFYNKTSLYYTLSGGIITWTISAFILIHFWTH